MIIYLGLFKIIIIYINIIFIASFFIFINKSLFSSNLCEYNRLLVSGASYSHGNLLVLMLHQIITLEKNLCFVLWDLGLDNKQVKIIKNIIKYVKKEGKYHINIFYKIFNFRKFPYYFNININAGEYAWKPIIIYYTYTTYKKSLFWLDAGCFINGSLSSTYNIIKEKGIWSISTGHSIKRYTYSYTLKYLNVSDFIQNQLMCTGGVVGFYYPSKYSLKLLKMWKECALNRECIAPIGSSRKNHRQDQIVLSIFLYKSNIKYNCNDNYNYNFSIQFDGKLNKYKDKDYYSFILKMMNI